MQIRPRQVRILWQRRPRQACVQLLVRVLATLVARVLSTLVRVFSTLVVRVLATLVRVLATLVVV
jgi:hypothetical protein